MRLEDLRRVSRDKGLLRLVLWVLFAVVCERIAKIMSIQTVQFIETVYAFIALYRTSHMWLLDIFRSSSLGTYTSLFRRGEEHSIPSTIQGAASLTSTASFDNSLSDMYRSPPRPLPYDADPRYVHLQRDGLVSRREKGSSHSQEETEPLRSDTNVDSVPLNTGDKWNQSTCEEGSKEYQTKSSFKLSATKATTGFTPIYSSSDDEDVCPTCLEEYTTENPKIITKCSHHFHLGCIYEWMERSESCPVCGKVMVFDETT
ncbi:hypothetical protein RHMOL_Rhmol10G0070100 [Rhododendron molle]|uniref:Uncharacterized protein n=1 Tax=Rhododendron molle TaxID=49168 RepID=A0ACC0M0A8_RHOML|nr:hypothetical protein RHMOL_Rhmol10G0070100 [Rhododendron molle]